MHHNTKQMDAYMEIARLCRERGLTPFSTHTLEEAMIFLDTEHHLEIRPGLTWCGCLRDTTEEDRESFADGNSLHDAATIYCTTLWIRDGTKLACRGHVYYYYNCQGHCGGVDSCERGKSVSCISAWDKSDDAEDADKKDDKTAIMIRQVTELLCTSTHDYGDCTAESIVEIVPSALGAAIAEILDVNSEYESIEKDTDETEEETEIMPMPVTPPNALSIEDQYKKISNPMLYFVKFWRASNGAQRHNVLCQLDTQLAILLLDRYDEIGRDRVSDSEKLKNQALVTWKMMSKDDQSQYMSDFAKWREDPSGWDVDLLCDEPPCDSGWWMRQFIS